MGKTAPYVLASELLLRIDIKKPNILKAVQTYAECDNVRICNVASCLLKKCS